MASSASSSVGLRRFVTRDDLRACVAEGSAGVGAARLARRTHTQNGTNLWYSFTFATTSKICERAGVTACGASQLGACLLRVPAAASTELSFAC